MTGANVFFRGLILFTLIGLPCVALADVNHDAGGKPAAGMQGMDHSKMNMDSRGDTVAAGGHWMAPEKAAQRPNPVKANNASRARGKKLFAANCASCHGVAGRGDGPAGAALSPKPADLAVMAGQHPDGDFAWKIANGRGPMPAWNGQLSDKNIWDLVNFIQGLAHAKDSQPQGASHQRRHRH